MKRIQSLVKAKLVPKADLIIKTTLMAGLLYYFLISSSLKYLIQ